MNRLLTQACGVLLAILLLPEIARVAADAIPALISVIVFLGIAHLAWPTSRRRR